MIQDNCARSIGKHCHGLESTGRVKSCGVRGRLAGASTLQIRRCGHYISVYEFHRASAWPEAPEVPKTSRKRPESRPDGPNQPVGLNDPDKHLPLHISNRVCKEVDRDSRSA